MMKTVNKANLRVVIIKTSKHIPKHHSSSLLLRPIAVHYYSTIFIRVDYLKWRCITVKQGETQRKISSPRKKIRDMFREEITYATVVAGLSSSQFDVKLPLMKGHYQHVKFAVGQPLGYYLSWSLFSLAHRKVVWWAALWAYPQQDSTFSRYAILGDDVVIADSRDRIGYFNITF
ncbi:hypothetical protein TIFTF001_006905 [Ficus carica]|uniref:Uncharacterized protein n=1 Tax=Ficus carica TaxID=3494 RepID=A0AA88DG44_FICCA|nr:hypothetical protein TIFTF001_006905 [Ficus carica]